MKKGLMLLPVLLMMTACDNKVGVESVRTLTVSAENSRLMGESLDTRKVCDNTSWTLVSETNGSARVTYQCDMSVARPQMLFLQQLDSWKEHNKRILAEAVADNKSLKVAALEKKKREAQLLIVANRLFKQLQASGDLGRYKILVKHAPVDNHNLETVEAFLSSEEGRTWLNAYPEAEKALASFEAVTQAVTRSGLATTSTNIDLCTAPAMLVLAPILSVRDVKKTLTECDTMADVHYEGDVASIDARISDATARLSKVDKDFTLAGVKETLTWVIEGKRMPILEKHILTLDVREGDTLRPVVQTIDFKNSNIEAVMDGSFTSMHQKALIMAMGQLIQ
ncbi:hypothetical protein [Yersinia frederiksenii]|uniref:hypothetical protein n=1 Tax=Yersinia frederiksenii TaxID=29484 RepID=UPI0005DAC311|nr:hypothetical protein [Yersinia frederiksenii]CQJ05550.1 Uncharacterised protein [Yersinia frederiksenii]